MPGPTLDTLRYLWGWTRGRAMRETLAPPERGTTGLPRISIGAPIPGVVSEELQVGGGSDPLDARLYTPSPARHRLHGWVLLHGVTLPGPEHPAIVRFAASLARAGGAVLVPDIPAWRNLELDPEPALVALQRSAEHLAADSRVRPGGVVLVGLSFGCPQALRVAARLAGTATVRGVVGFGTYCNLQDTIRFGLTGQFRWRGRTEYLRPDPYGRWVVASNYLHRIPGYEGTKDVSRALGRLASLAGERRIMSWDPGYDGVKDELGASVARENRHLFRLFAPPADREPDPVLANELAPVLADTARTIHPRLELPRSLHGRGAHADAPPPPVHLIHGGGDHLIPFTETLALERRLRKRTDVTATVTGLFAHSRESGRSTARLREAARFFAALRGAMTLHHLTETRSAARR